jgi:exodeoxyribonuclease V gamma subunit
LIKLYSNNSYSLLYQQLKELIVENHSVFSESWIVVPNHSAKLWLQKSLAKDLGVCAQIKFIMPLSFNWEVIKNTSKSNYQHNVFSADVIVWHINQIIKEENDFAFLKKESRLSQFNLSEKLARTFLGYCEDQPETIKAWDENNVKESPQHQWQSQLWRCVLNRLNENSPVRLLQLFNPESDFLKPPATIILFATEQLTTLQSQTLMKLGQYQDIHLMISNPCPEIYWYDIVTNKHKQRKAHYHPLIDEMLEVGHPLLASLGRSKMALLDSFLSADVEAIDIVEHSMQQPQSLLQSLKSDIFELNETADYFKTDDSINIHSCHNKNREIEVIQDQILFQLDNNLSLNPEDIIVLAPDINDYVPLIHQAFDDSSKLPYHIDRRRLADANYIISLMALLESFTQEMSASNIYQLLSHESLLEKFNLTSEDLPRIKTWMSNSNIRNYYSAQVKSDLGYEFKQGNTWQFGENRWLSGYLTGDEKDLEHLSTYGEIAGQESLFQSVFKFLDLWHQTHIKLTLNHSPLDWFELIKNLCSDFLYNDFVRDYETQIIKQLEQKFVTQPMGCIETIPLTIVQQIIDKVICENNYRSEGQIGIRFQSWENAFIADAKLLILIGLNEKDFPKNDVKNDMDLFQNRPAKLNKSIRLRDKNLMLSALTETAEQLVISYIGFSEKNNDPQPPSIIISELINYLQEKTNNEFQVQQHRMHGFNKVYYDKDKETRSYNQNNFKLSQCFYDKKEIISPQPIQIDKDLETQIPLDSLTSFFVDPLNYFLKNQAQLNPSIYADLLKDNETYHPDGLEQWQIKGQIFNHSLAKAEKTGIISDNKAGMQKLQAYNKSLQPLLDTKQQLLADESWLDFTQSGYRIFGTVSTDKQGNLYSIYPKELSKGNKQLCEHWLKHLCYKPQQESTIYFEKDTKVLFKPIENPQQILESILTKWQDCFKSPWLFHPPSSIKILASSITVQVKDTYLKSFIATQNTHPSEGMIYFYDLIKEADLETQQSDFISSMLENIEVIK